MDGFVPAVLLLWVCAVVDVGKVLFKSGCELIVEAG